MFFWKNNCSQTLRRVCIHYARRHYRVSVRFFVFTSYFLSPFEQMHSAKHLGTVWNQLYVSHNHIGHLIQEHLSVPFTSLASVAVGFILPSPFIEIWITCHLMINGQHKINIFLPKCRAHICPDLEYYSSIASALKAASHKSFPSTTLQWSCVSFNTINIFSVFQCHTGTVLFDGTSLDWMRNE